MSSLDEAFANEYNRKINRELRISQLVKDFYKLKQYANDMYETLKEAGYTADPEQVEELERLLNLK